MYLLMIVFWSERMELKNLSPTTPGHSSTSYSSLPTTPVPLTGARGGSAASVLQPDGPSAKTRLVVTPLQLLKLHNYHHCLDGLQCVEEQCVLGSLPIARQLVQYLMSSLADCGVDGSNVISLATLCSFPVETWFGSEKTVVPLPWAPHCRDSYN